MLKAKTLIFLILSLILSSMYLKVDFLKEQMKFARVREAIEVKQQIVDEILKNNQLSINNFQILLVAYKDNDRLDIFAKSKQAKSYRKIYSYKVCNRSGMLGPKRKQGDRQVPEGFYFIDRFNPLSNYHLSLGINYPNNFDKLKSKYSNLGGDIFIHGACETIGCLPMTDEKMKEIYLMAIHAKNNGQAKIPVYIFPFEMTNENMAKYKNQHKENFELIYFWENLKLGYDLFQKRKEELSITYSESGDYKF